MRLLKLNSRGFSHHLLFLLIPLIAIGAVGAYVLNKSGASTASVCGALYNSNKVVSKTNAAWDASKNDPSVRNMAYAMCKLKLMDVTAANAVNSSGTWTPALKASIVKFQLSKSQLKGQPDGYPGPLTSCMMGLVPSGFSNNSCTSVTTVSAKLSTIADPVVPKPTVSLKTSATTVKAGGSVTLTWAASGIEVTCKSTMTTAASVATSGTYAYKVSDAAAHAVTLTCTNPGGSSVASVTITGTSVATTPPPVVTPPTIDTAPYTTLPVQPAATSTLYAAWKAWAAAISTANAQKLTGQALVTALTQPRQAYIAAERTAALAIAPSFTCSALQSVNSATLGVSINNTGKQVIDLSALSFASTTPASTASLVVTTGSIAVGKSSTTNFISKNPVTSGWSVVFKSGIITTTAECVKPGVTPPASSTVIGTTTKPIDTPPTTPTPNPNPTPTTPTPAAAKPKIADLGYTAALHCVTTTKNKAIVDSSPCSSANAIMLTVYGNNKIPAKDQLSYDIDVLATADKFGRADGCSLRTIVINKVDHTYGCTVLYTDKSFFASVKNSVTNVFNSIIGKAKADSFLNKSEAKAAVAKLQKVDALKKGVTITFAHKGYETQVITGTNLTFDYNEASSIQRIKDIQEQDCVNAGGKFVSFADGCDLPSPPQKGAGTAPPVSGKCKSGYTLLGSSCVSDAVLQRAQAAADAANATANHLSTKPQAMVASQYCVSSEYRSAKNFGTTYWFSENAGICLSKSATQPGIFHICGMGLKYIADKDVCARQISSFFTDYENYRSSL